MSDRYDHDSELDEMLRPAIDARPRHHHVRQWQLAVQFELNRKSWFRRQLQSLPQMAAGLALGCLLSVWYFHSSSPYSVMENVEPSATILHVFTKAD